MSTNDIKILGSLFTSIREIADIGVKTVDDMMSSSGVAIIEASNSKYGASKPSTSVLQAFALGTKFVCNGAFVSNETARYVNVYNMLGNHGDQYTKIEFRTTLRLITFVIPLPFIEISRNNSTYSSECGYYKISLL